VADPRVWLSISELVEIGFEGVDVVLVNEAHHGLRRCSRTRRVGLEVVAVAHALGVRRIAVEALHWGVTVTARARGLDRFGSGYLAQPDMRALLDAALNRGWAVHGYEAAPEPDPARHSAVLDATNARESAHALHLAAITADGEPTLVWCGNGHLLDVDLDGWRPMGRRLRHDQGVETFAIDQTRTVTWPDGTDCDPTRWLPALHERGGVAGFLASDVPDAFPDVGADAYVVAIDNAMV
jgi:hypothetical protein